MVKQPTKMGRQPTATTLQQTAYRTHPTAYSIQNTAKITSFIVYVFSMPFLFCVECLVLIFFILKYLFVKCINKLPVTI